MKKTCFFTVLLFCFLFLNMVSCEKTDHIHVFDEWKQISESTCSEQGEAVRNCTVKGCDYSEKKSTDLKKHDYQDNIVAPTKTKDGYTAHICKNCSHSFTDTYVPAIGSSNLQYDYIETDGNVTCVITGIGSCTDTNVYIPSYIGKYPVTAIDTGAFKGITTIKSVVIPSGITEIGERAFSGCSGLETITISNTIKKIKDEAFLACESLNGVYISDLSSWCNIQFGATTSNPLYYAKKLFLNDQHITSLIIPENVTVINHFAFINCTYISEITIHNMVTYIGCQSFYNCGVTTVIIPDSVNTIEAAAFAACVELTDIKLPATLTSIEMGAFQGCLALKSIDIPKSVITIGNQAFKGCKNLVSIIIPQNVTGIDSGAFEGCESLKSIIFKNTNNWRSYRNYDLQGTPIDVSDPTQNAIIFIQANTFTSWKRQ